MYREAAKYIRGKIDITPDVGLILGSGLSNIANLIDKPIIVNYDDIPNFPLSTVEGHEGRFVIGKLGGRML